MKKALHQCLFLCSLSLLTVSARAGNPGIAYSDPPGGWTYVLNGDTNNCGSGAWDSLDGTWNRSNGSSEWDCSAVGGTIMAGNFPGGVSLVTNGAHASETGVSYLRIQDPGNPSQFSGAANNGCGGCTIANPA